MKKNFEFFGERNFRFPVGENNRGRVNIAMLESVSLFFSNHDDSYLESNKDKIKSNYKILLSQETYREAVRFSTGDKKRVIERFQICEEILANQNNSILLTEEEISELSIPLNNMGGWQKLFLDIQKNINGDRLYLNEKLVDRILKYSQMKTGGLRKRIIPIAEKIKKLVEAQNDR